MSNKPKCAWLLPRTQTPLSSLHQLEPGRGSPFLHSSPGPLCEENDSCQRRWREEEKGEAEEQREVESWV